MSNPIIPTIPTVPVQSATELALKEANRNTFLMLNGYNVQRIVYELIRKWMISNTPEEVGVTLAQKYDPDVTKSGIFLDVAYNWKAQSIDKLPAIYVQRGDIDVGCPTFAQEIAHNIPESEDSRMSISTMPVKISCIAAAPIAVVENLAEYIKQPLLCFRKEVKLDFKLRHFKLSKITSPVIVPESKNNFVIDLIVDTAFDEGWIIQKDSLKLKSVGYEILSSLSSVVGGCQTCS